MVNTVSQPIDRHVGELFFEVVVHQVFVFVFGVLCCTGPAAEIDFRSGPADIKTAAAVQTFFLDLSHGYLNPLSFKT